MNNQKPNLSGRALYESKVTQARHNLLLMIILTTINVILLLAKSNYMLLFSASVPYFSVILGETIITELSLTSSTPLVIGIGIAVVTLLLYLLCWIFSKKNYGWMIVALVLFILDTLFMGFMYLVIGDFSGILDVIIHIWVLYYLIIGVKYGYKLNKTPEEVIEAEIVSETVIGEDNSVEDSSKVDELETEPNYSQPIKRAEEDVKFRVLLESEYEGHTVCYRRVKRVNQLVVDDYVYDEVEMLIETSHELEARIAGHTYTVGYDGKLYSYFNVDDDLVAKKIRWY